MCPSPVVTGKDSRGKEGPKANPPTFSLGVGKIEFKEDCCTAGTNRLCINRSSKPFSVLKI